MEVLSADGDVVNLSDDDDDLERAASNLGINLSHDENASVEDLA